MLKSCLHLRTSIEDLTARTSLKFKIYYNSTGYGDELLWAASWLYHATTDQTYLDYVTGTNGESFANWGSRTWFSWDDKLPGTQLRLQELNELGRGADKLPAVKPPPGVSTAKQSEVNDEPIMTKLATSVMLDEVNLNGTSHGGNSSSDNEVVVGEDEELVTCNGTSTFDPNPFIQENKETNGLENG
ncbi:endoglucanase 2-like protein [Tanacetum coccineum]